MLSSLIFKVHCHTKSMIHVITHCQLAYVCGTRLCVMHVRRRNKCWKSCANGSNIVALRFGDHGTEEMVGVVRSKDWPVSNCAQQLPAIRSLCSRRLEVVGERENGRCVSPSRARFFLCPLLPSACHAGWTIRNNMQQGVQTDATCNSQQCCVRWHGALEERRTFCHFFLAPASQAYNW